MKPKYKLDKRQKELARKQKQERKQEEKLARKKGLAPSPSDSEGSATN